MSHSPESASSPSALALPAAAPLALYAGPSNPPILVIDDGEIKRYTTCRVLEQAGYSVVQAVTGTQGLLLSRDNPSLIVLDVKLPDMDGFEVCRRIKADPVTANTPVLHLSAHRTTSLDRAHGLNDGADAYLTVPVDPEVLIATVRALLRLRNAEEQARGAVRYWRATFDAISDAVFLADGNGIVIRYNNGGSALAKATTDDFLGKSFASVLDRLGITSSPGSAGTDAVLEYMTAGGVEKQSAGGRWLRIMASAVEEGVGGFVCTLTDVTDRITAEQSRAEVALRNERIAETLQRTLLLTPNLASFPGLEIEPVYRAALEESLIGGDFYDVVAMREGQVAFIVGDVTGKGLEAATCTAEIKFVLRSFLRDSPDPALALRKLNEYLFESHTLDRDTPETFVSLALAVVHSAAGTVVSSSAGAEPPLLLPLGQEVGIELNAGGPLLAIDGDSHYQSIEAAFEPGDLLIIATDGITEARRRNTFFGLEGMSRAVGEARRDTATVREIAQAIVSNALSFANGRQKDDVCLLVVRRCIE